MLIFMMFGTETMNVFGIKQVAVRFLLIILIEFPNFSQGKILLDKQGRVMCGSVWSDNRFCTIKAEKSDVIGRPVDYKACQSSMPLDDNAWQSASSNMDQDPTSADLAPDTYQQVDLRPENPILATNTQSEYDDIQFENSILNSRSNQNRRSRSMGK